MEKNNKQKRFYKVNEVVWVIPDKKKGTIKSINKEDLTVDVIIDTVQKLERGTDKVLSTSYVVKTYKMWEIDKLKYNEKKKFINEKKKEKFPTIYFAKVRKDAIIPSKRDEDAGYDVYSNLEAKLVEGKEVREILCPKNKTTLVPTGIAMALPKTHYFNLKHERGSTGKISMSVLSGVIDSGYRGELFIAITPLYKDIVITSEVTETEENENEILYPYSKAICQGTIDLVPQVNIKEISFEELSNIKSERGDTKLGQSGK